MRLARLIMVLAVLIASLELGQPAFADRPNSEPLVESEKLTDDTEIRPASQAVSDRQRERRRARRDRTRRRFGRGSTLLPHFADYAIHETGFATTRFKSATGVMTIELVNDCGDWTLQEKLDLELDDQADRTHQSNLLYRASEVASADKFVFAYSSTFLDQRDDFIGDVLEVNDGYMARYQVPEIADVLLPSDLVFPVTHLRQVLSAAIRKRTEFEMIVFDGGNSFPYRAVTTISQPLRGDDPNKRVVAARTELDSRTSDRLPVGRSWQVRVEYFPVGDAYAPPVYVREFLLHESGIVLSFHLDYVDIQMDARLKNLDIREAKPCSN